VKYLHSFHYILPTNQIFPPSSIAVTSTATSITSSTASSPPGAQNFTEDNKTKRRDEDTLPPEFRKRLTEWEIGKVLAGKSCQNVDELQKNLGEEFNKKMAEWERIKGASATAMPNTSPC